MHHEVHPPKTLWSSRNPMRLRTTVPALALSALLAILSGCSHTTTTGNINDLNPVTGPITVAIGLTNSSIEAGSSLPLTAGVANDASLSGVTWTLTSGPGSVGNTGTFAAVYFAPATLTAATTASVTATSIKDTTKSYTATFAVTPGVSFAAQTLPVAYVGTPYSANITASGGTGTLHYTVSSGTLPAGLALSSAGVLSGTPTAAYTGSFTVQITDDASPASTIRQAISVTTSAIAITGGTATPYGTVGQAYTYSLAATGANGATTWTVASGSLPAGLTLAANGAITGTPTTAGTYQPSVRVTDAAGATTTQGLTLKIAPALAISNATTLPSGTVGQAFSYTLAANSQSGTVNWYVSSGTMPVGLALSSNGSITGTPTAATTGTSVTVTATASTGGSASAVLNFQIASSPVIANANSATTAVINNAYSFVLTATGTSGTITWSIASGNLPTGLSLSTNGNVSGTPSVSGTTSATVQVVDVTGGKATATVAITVNPSTLAFTAIPLPNTVVGAWYSALLAYTGNSGSVTASGTGLPDGLTLNSTGHLISGYPTAAGTFSPNIQLSDAAGTTVSRTFTITVGATSLPKGAQNAMLNGSYAILLQGQLSGTTYAGYGNPPNGIIGSLHFDGTSTVSGTLDVLSGIQMVNTVVSTTTVTGSYALDSDRRGFVILSPTYTPAKPIVLSIVVDSISAGGIASEFQVQKSDYDPGTLLYNNVFEVGTGKLQTLPNATTAALSGKYILGALGRYGQSSYMSATAGMLNADGNGNFSGLLDAMGHGAGAFSTTFNVTGTYSAPNAATGRGTFTLSSSDSAFKSLLPSTYVYYIVGPAEWLLMSTDAAANYTLTANTLTGNAHLQTGAGFTNASLSGGSVAALQSGFFAFSPSTLLGKVLSLKISSPGVVAIDALAINNTATVATFGSPETATYSIDSNGRVTFGNSSKMNSIFWLVDNNQGFGIELVPNNLIFPGSGIIFGGLMTLEAQSLSPSTFPGTFSWSEYKAPYQGIPLVGALTLNANSASGTFNQLASGSAWNTTSAIGSDGTVKIGTLSGLQVDDSRAILVDTTSATLYLLQK
jgi:hypothetical protein